MYSMSDPGRPAPETNSRPAATAENRGKRLPSAAGILYSFQTGGLIWKTNAGDNFLRSVFPPFRPPDVAAI